MPVTDNCREQNLQKYHMTKSKCYNMVPLINNTQDVIQLPVAT